MNHIAHYEAHQYALPKKNIILIYISLLIVMFLASLDQLVFATALPTIVGELNGVDLQLWVTTAYILAATIIMPIYGKVSDIIGRRPTLITAICVFIIGSIVGGLAGNIYMLIAGRAIQGLGGGGLIILSQSVIGDIIPAKDRGKFMGPMGAIFGVSAVIGPVLGGWFTDSIGWRWAFWMNLPLGAVALLAIGLFLRLKKAHNNGFKIDYFGIITMAIWVTSIVLISTWGGSEYDWGSWQMFVLYATAVVFLFLFIIAEHFAKDAIIPLMVFKNKNYCIATLGGLLIAVAMFGAISYIPTYIQYIYQLNATQSGLLLTPMVLGILITSVLSGQIASRAKHYKYLPLLGCVITACGMYLLSITSYTDTILRLSAGMFTMGAGIGCCIQLLVLIVQNEFSAKYMGIATGSNNFFRELGASLGTAIVGSVFTTRLINFLGENIANYYSSDAYIEKYTELTALQLSGAEDQYNQIVDICPLLTDPDAITSLTPSIAGSCPNELLESIQMSYNSALMPIFIWLTPLMAFAFVTLFFLTERKLSESLEDKDLQD